VGLERQDHVVEADGLPLRADHAGDREAPDVGVEDPDLQTLLGERHGEVHRDARLADPALARRDRDDGGGRGERDPMLRRLGARPPAELVHERLPLLLAHRREGDLDALHPGERAEGGGHVLRDAVLQRAALDRDQDVDADEPVLDLDPPEHPDVLDRATDLRVEDRPERLADLCLADHPGPLGVGSSS
jgi:hypothetical protein